MNNTKKDMFLKEMLTAKSVTQAANNVGIARQTAAKYLKEPDFQERLKAEREKILEETRNYLSGCTLKCSYELMKIITNEKTPAAVKVQAINTVFANVARMTDEFEIIDRLVLLERQVKKR